AAAACGCRWLADAAFPRTRLWRCRLLPRGRRRWNPPARPVHPRAPREHSRLRRRRGVAAHPPSVQILRLSHFDAALQDQREAGASGRLKNILQASLPFPRQKEETSMHRSRSLYGACALLIGMALFIATTTVSRAAGKDLAVLVVGKSTDASMAA